MRNPDKNILKQFQITSVLNQERLTVFFKQVHTPGKSQNLNIFGQGGPAI